MAEINNFIPRGNDFGLEVRLNTKVGDNDPEAYDLTGATDVRLALIGHGMHVFAKDVEVSDTNLISGTIPGRALLLGLYGIEITCVLDHKNKRFAVNDIIEVVDEIPADSDDTAEGEGGGLQVTITIVQTVLTITGPAGADGQPGTPGQDGVSPEVDVEEISGGHKVTISDAEGDHEFNVMDGATGPQGPQGPQGETGPAGEDGAQGPQGPQGPQGEAGPAGATGATGPQGPAGATGAQGPAGADGVSPTISATSITGGHRLTITDVNGTSTVDVMDGTPGAAGPQGEAGPRGPQGLQGEQGDPGSSQAYPFTLANNLTTDDSTVALTAAQGVVLKGMADSAHDALENETTVETVSELIPYGQHIGYIGSNAINNQSSGNNRYSDPIFLKAGESLKIKAITATNVGRLASYDPDTEAVTTLLMGQSQGTNSASYAYENTYTATDDIYLIVGWWWDYVQLELTKTYTKKTVTSRLDEIDPINESLEMETESGTVTEDMALTMTSGEYYSGITAGRAAGLSSNANMSCSNVFDFKKGDVFEIKTKNAPGSLSVFSIKDGTLFRCVAPGAGSGEQTVNYTAPYDGQGAVSFKTSEGITVKRTRVLSGSTSRRLDEMEEDVDAAVAAVTAMSATVASLDASVRDDTDDDLTQDIVSGKFINHAGGVFENENFAYKEFDVRTAAQIKLVCLSHNNIAAIAKKISSTEYQELVAGNESQTTFEYTATENMTIAVSFYSTHDRSIEIRADNVESNMENIDLLLAADQSRRQEALVQDIDFGLMFGKVAVIGDSLASGTVEGIQGQPDSQGDAYYGYSWLSHLAKRWRCSNLKHYSRSGETTASWLTYWLPIMQADATVYDAYFIALGTNNEYDESDPTGDATNLAAYVSRYNDIIDAVRAKAPHAVIFIMSLYQKRAGNDTLEDIAETRMLTDDGVFYLDYANEAKYLRYSEEVNWRGHFSTTGYVYVASAINQIVNGIVWDNQEEEFWQQFAKYHNVNP